MHVAYCDLAFEEQIGLRFTLRAVRSTSDTEPLVALDHMSRLNEYPRMGLTAACTNSCISFCTQVDETRTRVSQWNIYVDQALDYSVEWL